MNIGFLIYSLSGGGAERVVSSLANYYSNLSNVSVYIILFDGKNIAYELQKNIQVHILSDLNGKNKVSKIVKKTAFIKSIVAINKIDVLFAFTSGIIPYAVMGTRGTPCKVIDSERTNPRCYGVMQRCFAYFFASLCNGYVFQTEGARNCYPKAIRKKSVVIGNPLQPNIAPWEKSSENDFCSVGRLVPSKDYKTLLQACELVHAVIPDFTLTIYGEGPLKSDFEEYVKAHGLSSTVLFKSFVHDISDRIAKHSAFVFSSKHEGMPNALLEAVAAGMPCISTDCEFGPREIIKDGESGLLVPVGDTAALAKAMITLCKNHDMRNRLAQNTGYVKERFSLEYITDSYLKYAKKVAGVMK